MSSSKAYSARDVNGVRLDEALEGRDGLDAWAGVDVGKYELRVVLHWAPGDFARPWRVSNPGDVAAAVGLLKRVGAGRKLVVAMEPSGTYGDVLRQACGDAALAVHRVNPKVAHDYAEVFDGVPSQHDGKDAAVVAELARLGKSAPWPWAVPDEREQQLAYWADRLDARRRLAQVYCGRVEALLARHWPEVPRLLKLTSATLLGALAEYGGPAALAADPQAAAKLKRWGRAPLTAEAAGAVVAAARATVGVRQQPADVTRLRGDAADALAARGQVREAKRRLAALAAGHRTIEAMAAAVGTATACVLWTELGDPRGYHCGAAYVKAMGLNLAERSSGVHQGRLKISKRGSGTVRYWLYLAALRLTKKHSPVRPWFRRKRDRDGGEAGRALVAIMRRLGLALHHVATRGEPFEAKRLFPGRAGGRQVKHQVKHQHRVDARHPGNDKRKADGKKADGKKADGKKADGKKADGKKAAAVNAKGGRRR